MSPRGEHLSRKAIRQAGGAASRERTGRYVVSGETTEKRKRSSKGTPRKKRRRTKATELQAKLDASCLEIETLEASIAALEETKKELDDEKLRFLAEMDNARKRAQKRLEDDRRFVIAELIKPMLDVADNMERALRSAEDGGSSEALAEGVEMVYRQLSDVLAQHGVTRIETADKSFDYNYHEAVGKTNAPGKDENEIVAEVSKGYLLNGRLLRPSKVIVAIGKIEDE